MDFFDYFSHEADTGIIGFGSTLEQAFIEAAKAMCDLITNIENVTPTEAIMINFVEKDPEFALVQWLNQIIAQAQACGMVLADFELNNDGDKWHGTAWGEYWHEGLVRGIDVKGATLTELEVRQLPDGGWRAQCVVDV